MPTDPMSPPESSEVEPSDEMTAADASEDQIEGEVETAKIPLAFEIPEGELKLPPEETIELFASMSDSDLTRFKSQRDEIDDRNLVADAMHQAMQNRAIESMERSKGMNMPDDTRANVGSPMFHRQVNQLSSQLCTVLYRGSPFRYSPRTTEHLAFSGMDSESLSAQANGLAKWNLQKIDWNRKTPEFGTSIFKYGTAFIGCSWVSKVRRTMDKKPVVRIEPSDGQPVAKIIGETFEIGQAKDEYVDFFLIHADTLWADRNISTIQQQNCVLIGRLRNRSEIYAEVLAGNFNKDAYEKITAQHAAGGTYLEAMTDKTENKDQSRTFDTEDLFIQWDIFRRCPISEDGAKWDDKNPQLLWWGTFIGNSPSEGICVRLERNPDPDDEIPVQEVNVYPSDDGDLYHTAPADIIRSLYSTDCTLLNMALDNGGLINNPPLLVAEGRNKIKDFAYRQGAKWVVDDVQTSVREFTVAQTGLATWQLRQMISEESMLALATDKPMMGMAHGGRTSASEANAISRNSVQPHMVQIRYILYQFLPWMGRKMMRYWQIFGSPDQVLKITEMSKIYEIRPSQLFGEFDVEIEIVDEYIDDTVRQSRVMQIVSLLAGSPWLQRSNTHSVDAAELLYQVFEDFRFSPSRIVRQVGNADTIKVARLENQLLMSGKWDAPQQGEDHEVHNREHQMERVRYVGLEEKYPAVALLDQHMRMHSQMLGSEQQAAQAMQMTANRTPGQIEGNPLAAMQGAMAGGGVNQVTM